MAGDPLRRCDERAAIGAKHLGDRCGFGRVAIVKGVPSTPATMAAGESGGSARWLTAVGDFSLGN